MSRTKISDTAPEWFHVVTEKKAKEYEERQIKQEDTLSVFSRYQEWITVTPRSKNRKMPLEKMKVEKFDETSKIMPKWMQIKPTNLAKNDINDLKVEKYNSLRTVKIIIYYIFFKTLE
jgi:hypothetical protein